MHYYDWKPLDATRAQRALDNGANIWRLPIQFGNGTARYSHALETKRGACYVISDRIFAALKISGSAWPTDRSPPKATHRSPFGPGAGPKGGTMKQPEQFFRGVIREPDGSGERVVVGKATKALAERMATTEAKKANWDWYVEHCRVDGTGQDQQITVTEQWSSMAGYESFE